MLAMDIFLLALINVIWGSTDVVAKFTLMEMSPGALMWFRFSMAFLAFLPVLVVHRKEIPTRLKGLAPFLALGVCGFFLNHALQYEGLKLAPASHATALRGSESLMIVLFSWLILKERISKGAIMGLVAGTLGIFLVLDIDLGNLGLFTQGARLGDVLILSGIILESLYTIIGKVTLGKSSPLLTTALACAFGWLLLTFFFGPSVISEFGVHAPSVKSFIACAYLGLVATVFCYSVYLIVLSRRMSYKVGMSIFIQPLAGIPLAAALLHDRITVRFVAGAAMILLGVYLALGRATNERI